MELDPLMLSRIQFAFVVCFHTIFPVFTIGLASYIALLQGLFSKRKTRPGTGWRCFGQKCLPLCLVWVLCQEL